MASAGVVLAKVGVAAPGGGGFNPCPVAANQTQPLRRDMSLGRASRQGSARKRFTLTGALDHAVGAHDDQRGLEG